MKKLLLAPFYLLSFIFGKFSWSPPVWLVACFSFLKRHIKIALTLLCGVLIAVGLTLHIQSLPKPVSTKAVFSSISYTSAQRGRGSKPSYLDVQFIYDLEALHENQAQPEGKPSTARIDLLDKEVKSGITLTPAKAGKWTWTNDNRLRFEPETPWPAGTQYEVDFDKRIFADEIRLSDLDYTFTTPPLKARMFNRDFCKRKAFT